MDLEEKKKIKNNKQHRANRKETEENIGATKNVLINSRFMKEIMKEKNCLLLLDTNLFIIKLYLTNE